LAIPTPSSAFLTPPLTPSTFSPYTTLFRSVEAQKPAAIVHTASDGRKRHPLTIVQASLSQQFYQRGSYAGIREITIIAEIINELDRKSTRLNSSHGSISYAVSSWKKKTKDQ